MSAPPHAGALRGAVMAMGNFEGVHRGHRAVIAAAIARARALGRPAAALTFEPHPRAFFKPDEPLFRLTDETAKLRLFAATPLDGAIVMTFDKALAELEPADFIIHVLMERFGISGVAVGFDFHFGKARAGSPAYLREAGERLGFDVDVVPALRDGDRRISSGGVREALAAGRPDEATQLLGYPWFVSGQVVHGDQRGRELGYPTANLRLDPDCGLRHGIYAVRVDVDGRRYDGVAKFGRRPMFDTGVVLLEIFFIRFFRRPLRPHPRRGGGHLGQAGNQVRQYRRTGASHGRRLPSGPQRTTACRRSVSSTRAAATGIGVTTGADA